MTPLSLLFTLHWLTPNTRRPTWTSSSQAHWWLHFLSFALPAPHATGSGISFSQSPQKVRLNPHLSTTLRLSIDSPQSCVLPWHLWICPHITSTSEWCSENKLILTSPKWKKLKNNIDQYNIDNTDRTTLLINGRCMERVPIFIFLGVHFDTNQAVKKAQQQRQLHLKPTTSQRAVHSISCSLYSLEDIFSSHCLSKAANILKDRCHLGHHLFDPLPSDRYFRATNPLSHMKLFSVLLP